MIEQLDQLAEFGERAGEAIDLVDHHGVDLASEPSICERDASGRFFPSTILMADLGIKIRPPLLKDQRHRDGLTGPALGQV